MSEKEKMLQLLKSYLRHVVGAAAALYMAGVTDPLDLAWSVVAALIPVGYSYVNPSDPRFGRMPAPDELEEALKNVKPKKINRTKSE